MNLTSSDVEERCDCSLCFQGTSGLAWCSLHGLLLTPHQCLSPFTQSSSLWMVKRLTTWLIPWCCECLHRHTKSSVHSPFLPYAVYNTAFKEFNMVFPSADHRQVVMTECIWAGVDGWLARRLDQCSRFGAWLDVVVDNVGRGMLWSRLFKVSRSNPPLSPGLWS